MGLCTHGLGRLELSPKPTITGIVREGIGTYPSTLLSLGHGLLGIGHRRGRTLLLASATDGTPVTRLRVAGPTLAYPLPDQRIRILGPHHAQATDIDVAARKVTARHQLPYAANVLQAGDVVTALIGNRRDYEVADDVWDVLPQHVAMLDPWTLQLSRQAPAPPDAVEILGADLAGNLIVTNHHGFALLDPTTLTTTATYTLDRQIRGAVHCPGQNLCGLLGGDDQDDALYRISW